MALAGLLPLALQVPQVGVLFWRPLSYPLTTLGLLPVAVAVAVAVVGRRRADRPLRKTLLRPLAVAGAGAVARLTQPALAAQLVLVVAQG